MNLSKVTIFAFGDVTGQQPGKTLMTEYIISFREESVFQIKIEYDYYCKRKCRILFSPKVLKNTKSLKLVVKILNVLLVLS